jgi:16S rRNA (adenine1518-N6/adenine1519-N6)-dimethyltransferase
VEIGAGLGTLTARLLATGAHVWAIERDRDMCHVLRHELGEHERFCLREEDAVRFDWSDAARDRPPIVVGNLPYHLTGPLLFSLLPHADITAAWVLMVQREVGQRLAAAPGTKAYGSVTAVIGRVREVEVVRRVPAGCFLPAPRVESVVVRLRPRPKALGEVADAAAFAAFVRVLFQRRRKTLLNALCAVADRESARAWIARCGLDPQIRPERLGPAEFAALDRARPSGS